MLAPNTCAKRPYLAVAGHDPLASSYRLNAALVDRGADNIGVRPDRLFALSILPIRVKF